MNKTTIIKVILLCAFITGCSSSKVNKLKTKQPNVLIILSDDQGWGDVGFNGCTDIPTPNLDQLAKEGIVFSQGYAAHPYCSPSRAGLLSGRNQQRFGHENNLPYNDAKADDGLPLDQLLISELLQKNDYKTCAIGKWHLGDSINYWPNKRGFDDWYGFWGGGMNYWGDIKKGRNEYGGLLKNGVPVPKSEITYLTDDFSNAAVNYIDQYKKEEKSFFMYLAYNAPHTPIQVTNEYTKAVDHIEDGDRAAYAAMVYGMDVGIGKVIQKLKDIGEYENTLIFFYSDNGGTRYRANNQPFRGYKGMLFEGGIRVPFLMTYPGHIKGGQTYEKMISALDIYPTILATTNIKHPDAEKLDGINLTPYLKGENELKPHNELYWRYSDGAGKAMRLGKYKMIMSGFKNNEYFLFDIENDPYEHHNLAKKYPEKLKEMQLLYDKWDAQNVDALWQDPHAKNISKEEYKRQSALDKATSGDKTKGVTNLKL
ncbi:sulfatase family protein [Flammeovirga pacifica]|uniref:N-acetylgalactosamine-6-sulfatase n=1 Tax=Flammeovirga pacifica TaxID=915059 RepID=A0A1S1YT42_FLAPC|nr:sulfatase-like hydrolase/transferase [Flammeovirga pacifica]OHX64197.1 N-acetylgalactosamine-6-sulfatase [Flammeovirga pacifica]